MNREHEPCGLECDCTDVCKQDNYKALWQQMCERCDELDKRLAQRQPLTDEELFKLWDEDMSCDMPDMFIQFKHTARAIEAAHGIKGQT